MVEEWLPELKLDELSLGRGANLDLFYSEQGSRTEKEVFWAGDGIQVWLQLLFHIGRLGSSDVLVIDEPDVSCIPIFSDGLCGSWRRSIVSPSLPLIRLRS